MDSTILVDPSIHLPLQCCGTDKHEETDKEGSKQYHARGIHRSHLPVYVYVEDYGSRTDDEYPEGYEEDKIHKVNPRVYFFTFFTIIS